MKTPYKLRKDYFREYSKKNKQAINARSKQWRQNNPEKAKAQSDKWRLTHPEKSKEIYKKWRDSKYIDYKKKNITKIRNYFKVAKRKRRNQIRNTGGSHSQTEWETLKAQYNWTCPCCHKSEPEIKLTEDHIIPIAKGGSDNIENIQPLCGICNSKKHTKIIKYLT